MRRPQTRNGDLARFIGTVRESNRQGRDAWERFAQHRERVHALLSGYASRASSVCLLGAGNLNDVRLGDLLDAFSEVHLVDLDVEAVHDAVVRHSVETRANLRVHDPIDLTGILDRLPSSTGESTPTSAEDLVSELARHRGAVPGCPFEVTASTGVLTQLLQSVVDSALAPEDVARVSLAVRDKHLVDLVHLTRPGGALLLVTDVVSTATAPGLDRVADDDLERELAALVAAGNFFTGTNPYRIVALLEEDPRLRPDVTGVELVQPWLWPVTPDRQHLTCAIFARRRALHRDSIVSPPRRADYTRGPWIEGLPKVDTILIENPSADGPYGAKGIGEMAKQPAAGRTIDPSGELFLCASATAVA